MSTGVPLIECCVQYQQGDERVRAQRQKFAEMLSQRLRQLVPLVVYVAGDDLGIDRSNFKFWTATPQHGGEHRPDLLVEVFPDHDLSQLSRLEPRFSDLLAKVAWREAAMVRSMFAVVGMHTLRVETRIASSTRVDLNLASGTVTGGWGTSHGIGRRFGVADPEVLQLLQLV